MKIKELLETEEHPLDVVAKKHNIPLSKNRKTASDFEYNDEVHSDLEKIGYEANWNGKRFDISKKKTDAELEREKAERDRKNSQTYKDSIARERSKSRSLRSDANYHRIKR